VVAELQPGELAREPALKVGEDKEHAECVGEARVELRNLPGCDPTLQRVVDA